MYRSVNEHFCLWQLPCAITTEAPQHLGVQRLALRSGSMQPRTLLVTRYSLLVTRFFVTHSLLVTRSFSVLVTHSLLAFSKLVTRCLTLEKVIAAAMQAVEKLSEVVWTVIWR